MKKAIVLIVAMLAVPALATEVLVLTSVTRVDVGTSPARKGFEVQNLGPNDIYCEMGPVGSTTPVLYKSRKVTASGGTWSASAKPSQALYCIGTVAQVTGTSSTSTTGGTIYSEVY